MNEVPHPEIYEENNYLLLLQFLPLKISLVRESLQVMLQFDQILSHNTNMFFFVCFCLLVHYDQFYTTLVLKSFAFVHNPW